MTALEQDKYVRKTSGYLPEASVAFIDEARPSRPGRPIRPTRRAAVPPPLHFAGDAFPIRPRRPA